MVIEAGDCIFVRFCDNTKMNHQQAKLLELIGENLQTVKQKMQEASARCSVQAKQPKLLAVTKYAKPEWIEALYRLGQRDFGENRPQQLNSRFEQYTQNQNWSDANWHLIGQLQRNKVKSVLGKTSYIHSIDSFRLLQRVEHLAAELKTPVRVLLQVNISGEESKQGFRAEELLLEPSRVCSSEYLSICGLMTMAPRSEDIELIRGTFRGLRELRDQLQQRVSEETVLNELSMGMSGDYEIAIEQGATIVRIGSRLFRNCPTDSA